MNTEKIIYNISVDLIRTICSELNKETKADMLIEKYLLKPSSGSSTKIKDKNAPKKNKSSYMFLQMILDLNLKKNFQMILWENFLKDLVNYGKI